MITIQDKEYPQKLRNIYDPPVVLYVKGNIDILNGKSLATCFPDPKVGGLYPYFDEKKKLVDTISLIDKEWDRFKEELIYKIDSKQNEIINNNYEIKENIQKQVSENWIKGINNDYYCRIKY